MTLFTASPRERQVTRTTPTARAVFDVIRAAWPALSDEAIAMLAAQSALECGGWASCWNWNLANQKSTDLVPHMYLANVWECLSPEHADQQVAVDTAHVHVATAEECRAHGWGAPSGKVVVVFRPPHGVTRFRAFGSLAEGAAGWIGIHQRIASAQGSYLPALDRGDAAQMAHIMKGARYYTADEITYGKGIAKRREWVRGELVKT